MRRDDPMPGDEPARGRHGVPLRRLFRFGRPGPATRPFRRQFRKRLVILYSMPLDFPATQMAEKGLRQALSEQALYSVQIFSEYLDLSRFRNESQRQALSDLLRHRYGHDPIDLVIAVDVPATHFLIERVEEAFPGVPVVVVRHPRAPSRPRSWPPPSANGSARPGTRPTGPGARRLGPAPLTRSQTCGGSIPGPSKTTSSGDLVAQRPSRPSSPAWNSSTSAAAYPGDLLAQCQPCRGFARFIFSTLVCRRQGPFLRSPGRAAHPGRLHENAHLGPVRSYFRQRHSVGGPMVSMRLQGLVAGKIALPHPLRANRAGDHPL